MDTNISSWTKYQQNTASGKPRSLLVEAVLHVSQKNATLDIGAGALSDVQFLLDDGFKEVVALDMTPQSTTPPQADGVVDYCM